MSVKAITMKVSLRRIMITTVVVSASLLWVWVGLAGLISKPAQPFMQSMVEIGRVVYERALLPGHGADGRINFRFWIDTLNGTSLILLTGLAVAVAFRASVLNIGAQGQYLAGAIAATAIGLHCPGPAWVVVPAVLLGAIAAGGLVAMIASWLERWRSVPVVLSTLLLNFIVVVALEALLQGPLGDVGQGAQSPSLPVRARLPDLLNSDPVTLRPALYGGLAIALLASLIVAMILRRTPFGFRLRAVGENPVASRFAGIAVGRVAALTLAFSGALAGLAGGIRIAAWPGHQLLLDLRSDGYGFTGIAVALLGRLSPVGVVLAALFFALLNTAFGALESNLDIPNVAAKAAQGIILIIMLIASRARH